MRLPIGHTLAGLLLAVPSLAAQKPDHFAGTWVLNVAKSKYTGAPAPQATTSVYTAAGAGYHVLTTITTAQGNSIRLEYTANLDGKDYPVTGSADYDVVSLTRVSAYHINFVRKRAGAMVQTGRMLISKDLRTRTVFTSGTNAAGLKITSVGLYERR